MVSKEIPRPRARLGPRAAFAGWQYYGYWHERELIREALRQQSHSVMNALPGGIRSHRRLGRFLQLQLQGMLEELAKSQDVLAVAVLSDDGRLLLSAGQTALLETEAGHLRELSQAAAGLAHETRNPLGLIRGWTQRLADADVDAPRRQEHARAVIKECDRLTARINQFLAFARPRKPALEPVGLDRLIDELATILQPDLETRNVALRREVPRSAATVRADRELLRQALFNLLQNAVQFSPEGEAVDVMVVSGQNGTSRIEVADRGPGVAQQSVKSLFTPYFTTRGDGTGLGLAIVKRIAVLHGWQTSYRSRPGGGPVFALDDIHA